MEKKNNGKGKVFLSKRNKKLNAISLKKKQSYKVKNKCVKYLKQSQTRKYL